MARFVQMIEYYQSKGQICDMPASSVIRVVGSTIIGYFVARELLASKMEWDDASRGRSNSAVFDERISVGAQ